MGRDGGTLGSDEISAGKGIYLTVILLILAVFVFFLANATQAAKDTANFYLLLSIAPLIAIVADMVIRGSKGKADLPDTVTIEKTSPVFGELSGRVKALIVAGSLAIGGLLLLMIGNKSTLALVSTPSFQLVQPGAVGSAYMSGAAGILENVLFFMFLMPTVYVVLHRVIGDRMGRKAISLVLAVLVAATIFTVYHVGVYGESTEALDSVFYFGLFCGGSTAALGMSIACDSMHFFNNFGVTYFRQTSGDILLWVLFYWILIALGTVMYLRRAR